MPEVGILWRGSTTDLVTDLRAVLSPWQVQELCRLLSEAQLEPVPLPILLWCPECNERHIDRGAFATKAHHTHACQFCGHVWRPAVFPTTGVQFLPGFRSEEL